jgi:hypothetical protein
MASRPPTESQFMRLNTFTLTWTVVRSRNRHSNNPMEDTRRATKQRYDWVRDFREGRAIVQRNGMYGVIDLDGNEVVPLKYDWIEWFYEGMVSVELNQKCGFVDKDGNEVVSPRYDWVSDYQEGMATVRIDGRYGIIDLDGNEVIPCWYTDVERQSYGFSASFRVSEHAVEHLYFNLDGHLIAQQVND